MRKVIVEITDQGWTTTVHLGDEIFVEKHVRTSYGSSGIEGNFGKESGIDEYLWEALDNLGAYSVMKNLHASNPPTQNREL